MNTDIAHHRTAVLRLPIRTAYSSGSWIATYRGPSSGQGISGAACFSEQEAIENLERILLGRVISEMRKIPDADKKVAKKPAMRQKL